MIWGAAVTQLRQIGGSVSGRTSLVRGSDLAVDVGVERSWRSHVEVFQHPHMLSIALRRSMFRCRKIKVGLSASTLLHGERSTNPAGKAVNAWVALQ